MAAASDAREIIDALKGKVGQAALIKAIRDLTRELRRVRRRQAELHDDDEEDDE